MKTISYESAIKKIKKISASKNSIAHKTALEIIDGKKLIRPVYISGSGRFVSNQNHTISITNMLQEVGIEYVLSNDAPQGGLCGNLITIKTKIKQKKSIL